MAPTLWLLLMMGVNVVGFHAPTHLTLARVFRGRGGASLKIG